MPARILAPTKDEWDTADKIGNTTPPEWGGWVTYFGETFWDPEARKPIDFPPADSHLIDMLNYKPGQPIKLPSYLIDFIKVDGDNIIIDTEFRIEPPTDLPPAHLLKPGQLFITPIISNITKE